MERRLSEPVCATHFTNLDRRYETAWAEERATARANLPTLDLSARDLRNADAAQATLVGANLSGARLEGADLSGADFRNANWTGATNGISPALSADLRTSQELTQSQLAHLIGNRDTLLPDRLNENDEPYYVWSCWETPPPDFDALVERAAWCSGAAPAQLSRPLLCGSRSPRRKTGTPLPRTHPVPTTLRSPTATEPARPTRHTMTSMLHYE